MGRLIFIISIILLFQMSSFGQESEINVPTPSPPVADPDHISNKSHWTEEKNRLLNFTRILKEEKTSTFYVIIGANNPKSKKLKRRKLRISNYLKNLGISKEMFNVVIMKSGAEETQYWIVPKEAQPLIS